MKIEVQVDEFLDKRVRNYDNWLKEGTISHSAKIIPVTESLTPRQWVLPTEQAMEILRAAKSIALQNCVCREHYQRCDNPREVCLTLNEVGDKFVARGKARSISLEEAAEVLRVANEHGLVHLTLYMPDHQVYALCSCCTCCCHDLQIVQQYGRDELVARSEYVAVTDGDACVHCGDCVDRCPFGARSMADGEMEYNADACLGCGLCVTICPAGATTMKTR